MSISVFLANANGTFARTTYGMGGTPLAVAVGDISGDGRADLATANFSSTFVSVRINNGDGTFAAPVSYTVGTGGQAIALADFNSDGRPDLVVGNTGGFISVLLGNGGGTFATAVNYNTPAPNTLTAVDVNGDGRPDLVATHSGSSTVAVLLSNGDGTFAPEVTYPVGGNPLTLAVGDLNGDGRPDLATSNFSGNNVSVLLNNGGTSGTFAAAVNYPTGTNASGVTIADLNGDGLPDLAVANEGSGTISVLLGLGNGLFGTATNSPAPPAPGATASGDFNGDGRADVAATSRANGTLSVLLNTSPGAPLPVFTQHPIGQVVPAGTSVSLTTSANFGATTPNYHWRRNGVPLSNGGSIFGATSATLTINPVSSSDEAVYDVQAFSAACSGGQNVVTSNAAVLAVGAPLFTLPANDTCSAAKRIGNGAYAFSTTGATTDGPGEPQLGFGGGDIQVGSDVWFLYTATCNGAVTVDLCGSSFDTKVAIYNGAACPTGAGTAIAGNDDATACTANTHASRVTFSVVAGHEYLIRIGGRSGAVGSAAMTISCDGSACLAADMGAQGGLPGRDGHLDNNDFIAFINNFFNSTTCP
ncbi:MAG: FG-GAP-like repeat-containing protein [Phycisphaerales bacterium]